jgi:hypothetical protein
MSCDSTTISICPYAQKVAADREVLLDKQALHVNQFVLEWHSAG